ncbi:hypothetical protein GCM10011375_10100 [Hymenobacter qilianensis]|uniref:Uncharacterized protein n=2 Tax=Hymenobacter qilianensis TaxID=1385715 RepID=A0ACB5PNT4_9BACT|nr:DUF4270 family protein [Hymenobacter qilianensis]QNP53391.1 DUF4270 family protein [Hymenobacter qilianensis]GGF56948.1 hypothetical protein GCM10011375_10100 [Hymenobacter qilianensis]
MNWPASAFRLTATLCFSAAFLLTTSCDDPNDIRVELPDPTSLTTDYSEFKAPVATILQDSLETLKADNFLVGRISDAALGTTTARSFLNLQVNMPADSLPAKFSGTVLDSTVMIMSFNQVYGSATQAVRFDVSALQQKLDDRSSYNANTSVPVGQVIGANLAGSLNRTRRQRQRIASTVTTDTATAVVTVQDRTVRLALSRPGQISGFVGSIFSALQAETFSQAQLDALWKGIAVAPTDNFTGTVVGFNRSNDLRVIFYFRGATATTPTKRRTYSIYFGSPPRGASEAATSINLNAPRYFTQITSDLSTAGPFARLTNGQAAVTSSEVGGITYVQEGVGFGTRLDIPAGLKALKDRKDIAINRAELIIPVKPFANALFPLPRRLYLYEANANNQVLKSLTNNFRTDRVILGDSIGGQGQRVEAQARLYDLGNNNNYYSVLITNYVQNYIYTQTDATRPATLILSPTLRTLPTLTLNRAVLDADNITLRVYYSKLR